MMCSSARRGPDLIDRRVRIKFLVISFFFLFFLGGRGGFTKYMIHTTSCLWLGSNPLCSRLLARRSNTKSFNFSAYSQPAGDKSESALYECSIKDWPDCKIYNERAKINEKKFKLRIGILPEQSRLFEICYEYS